MVPTELVEDESFNPTADGKKTLKKSTAPCCLSDGLEPRGKQFSVLEFLIIALLVIIVMVEK